MRWTHNHQRRAPDGAEKWCLEGVKKSDRLLVEWRGTANPGGGASESAHAAMPGLTRHFRAAFARKCSVCPRIAPKDQSGRHRSVATTVDCQEFWPTRSPFRFFHMFLTPVFSTVPSPTHRSKEGYP